MDVRFSYISYELSGNRGTVINNTNIPTTSQGHIRRPRLCLKLLFLVNGLLQSTKIRKCEAPFYDFFGHIEQYLKAEKWYKQGRIESLKLPIMDWYMTIMTQSIIEDRWENINLSCTLQRKLITLIQEIHTVLFDWTCAVFLYLKQFHRHHLGVLLVNFELSYKWIFDVINLRYIYSMGQSENQGLIKI